MDGSDSDINLNQEPVNQPVGSSASGFTSLWNEFHALGPANDSIEERFRQLKAATLRAGLSRRWQRICNLNENGGSSIDPIVDVNGGRGMHGGEESGGVIDSNVDKGKGCKRESGLLVAMALEMDTEIKKVPEDVGSFYDCNICLHLARDPILTCCGHMFCWACFFKLPYVDSTAKECPVCEGEVTDSNVIPIYGNGDSTRESKLESGMTIPPRPKAQRVEGARQQRVARGVYDIPVGEALRRIRTSISAMGDNPPQEDSNRDTTTFVTNFSMREENRLRRLRSLQMSRRLPERATSLSSASSALNVAETVVESLGTFLNNRRFQRSDAPVLSVDNGDTLTRNAAISQSEHQISSEEISSAVAGPSSSGTSDNFIAIEQTENMTNGTAGELNLPPRFHSPSRRRNSSSRGAG
ncbi:breast cancer type 1 susceptibility protein [Coffea eugenioides]|uniref:E3 ubiquitin-protein ligase RMA n=1 Tax=Coffea arabica TaxID=13443 RepID=A0A6P6VUA2_COFAR|nr:breast cancer type 1 susceptibility protein-like [Coffea arabica]XP_027160329.1 breast cancer type 1 susceptibility protein [Coffea eugenioides]